MTTRSPVIQGPGAINAMIEAGQVERAQHGPPAGRARRQAPIAAPKIPG